MTRRRTLLLQGTVWLVLVLAVDSAHSESQPPSGSPSSKATEALRLIESQDPYQRQLGFLRLEALREPSTADAIQRYVTHKDPDLRAYALRALAAINGLRAVPLLLEAFRTDKQPRVRRAALLGLEPLQKSDPQILQTFLRALRDKNTEVRMTAVDIVSRIDDPKAREAIRLRYKRERRRDVRRVLQMAVKRIGQP